MRQRAPEPELLFDLVKRLSYKRGWSFRLNDLDRGQGSEGLTLVITVQVPDSNDQNKLIGVAHYMIVPAASYNEQSWRRWLFEQIRLVESYEAAEFFMIDGERPYAPLHGSGWDPYLIAELTTHEEQSKTVRD